VNYYYYYYYYNNTLLCVTLLCSSRQELFSGVAMAVGMVAFTITRK